MEAVSKTDIRAIRECDTLALSIHQGAASIWATKRIPDAKRGPFDDHEKRVDIPCAESWSLDDYGVKGGLRTIDKSRTDAWASAQQYDWSRTCALKSLAAFIRPGDILALHFVAGNSNGYLRDARCNEERLYRDECYVVVQRERKGKTCEFPFFLDVSICADNSARMTHVAHKSDEYALVEGSAA